ncbi:hypothetical protein ACP275_03G021800 [Erythranthe tilingii]
MSDKFVRIGNLLNSFDLQEEITYNMIDSFKKIARLPVTTVELLKVVWMLKRIYGFGDTVIVFKQLPNSEDLMREGTRLQLRPVLMNSIFHKTDANIDSLRQRLTTAFPP